MEETVSTPSFPRLLAQCGFRVQLLGAGSWGDLLILVVSPDRRLPQRFLNVARHVASRAAAPSKACQRGPVQCPPNVLIMERNDGRPARGIG